MASADPRRTDKRVAVMQPYFLPYAGYFRLFHEVDEFVVYDCVQFPRRGRVHRTEVPGSSAAIEWLTLPLVHQPRDVRIMDLRFAPDARERLDERLERLAVMRSPTGPAAARVSEFLRSPLEDVVGFVENGLRLACELLGLPFRVSRSSALDIDPSVRGQERVLAVAVGRGATTYVNAPGGLALYDADRFRDHDIELRFLAPYEGAFRYLLPALMTVDPAVIAADIRATTRLLDDPATS